MTKTLPVTLMLWLARAITVGLGRAVKMENSLRRDLAARLTRNIMRKLKAAMTAIAYTTSNTSNSCNTEFSKSISPARLLLALHAAHMLQGH